MRLQVGKKFSSATLNLKQALVMKKSDNENASKNHLKPLKFKK